MDEIVWDHRRRSHFTLFRTISPTFFDRVGEGWGEGPENADPHPRPLSPRTGRGELDG
jgi:hypothetical protein